MMDGLIWRMYRDLSPQEFVAWVAAQPLRYKLLAFATLVFLIELGLRYLAPKSRVYARWTALFQAIGSVWTAVLLFFIYVVSVGPVGLVQRMLGRDPLERGLAREPSFWRSHEANPLGPERAARHQF
jgi:hypothetical protein